MEEKATMCFRRLFRFGISTKSLVAFSSVFLFIGSFIFLSSEASAVAKESTISMTLSSETLELTLPNNSFGKTSNLEIGVHTDNYSGYNLTIASEDSAYLVNGDAVISSIGDSITEQTFRSSSNYNNMFGYVPSQYISSQNTVVQNTNFLPIPDQTVP